ncbi:UDP-N-acetylmuramate:L-alanyl-gamma-D-glutamyl-meso-diaminopimelate ligase [Aliidiomarina minuta]|uniref:UDP-N-acetylmuramate--L-alanyl-gamma-D-glutamyl-meso-2,6-diaminoheptandioate ligase n=1 Tax=Aliidiomarina minuta TaxID=880057 RepID=A0A432W4B1_9GAMM|nr:UDP-N-acetylmuramate:L-alanyl-gamma-D-glutamyl-meso-diaminopimelate ligase [Aliidiomarina minuta]RUO24274.1 UDP-N-acetylmuramate:L-alanyl-gamma-D-glutamyl-meso-diaminopimelate ligase [Aliidiomarina minuta]
MHIHILGICGTFMGGIAAIARELGHRVTGSDRNVYPPMSTQLENMGIEINQDDDLTQLEPAPDLVIIGNAMSRGHPLVEAVLNARLPYTSGPAWLGEQVLRHKWVLAVAGTHGKTTTASMLAHILQSADMQPGFLIGGVLPVFGCSARLTESPFFIIEADEYDTAFFDKRSKFVHYYPDTLALNNLEFDHADIFPDLAAIQRQFHHLVRTVPGTGCVLAPADDSALQEVLREGCWSELQWLNEAKQGWSLSQSSPDGCAFNVNFKGELKGRVEWALLGQHNMANALMAIAAAQHAGVPATMAVQALNTFAAPKRRLELYAEVAGIKVYDDFAHHPTAMQSTLQGLRAHVGQQLILAVIEPGSNTMRQGVHKATLAPALKLADQVYAYDNGRLEWSLQDISEHLQQPWHISGAVDELVQMIARQAASGCHVLLMSNSSFGGLREKLQATLIQMHGDMDAK